MAEPSRISIVSNLKSRLWIAAEYLKVFWADTVGTDRWAPAIAKNVWLLVFAVCWAKLLLPSRWVQSINCDFLSVSLYLVIDQSACCPPSCLRFSDFSSLPFYFLHFELYPYGSTFIFFFVPFPLCLIRVCIYTCILFCFCLCPLPAPPSEAWVIHLAVCRLVLIPVRWKHQGGLLLCFLSSRNSLLWAFPKLSWNISQLDTSPVWIPQPEMSPHLALSGPKSYFQIKWKSPLSTMSRYRQDLSQHANIPWNEPFRHFITCLTYLPFAIVYCQTRPLMQQLPLSLRWWGSPCCYAAHSRGRWRLWWAKNTQSRACNRCHAPDRPGHHHPMVLWKNPGMHFEVLLSG